LVDTAGDSDLEVLCGEARASCMVSGRVLWDGLARVRGVVESLLQLVAAGSQEPVRLPGSGR
jgi:hypothetical protein